MIIRIGNGDTTGVRIVCTSEGNRKIIRNRSESGLNQCTEFRRRVISRWNRQRILQPIVCHGEVEIPVIFGEGIFHQGEFYTGKGNPHDVAIGTGHFDHVIGGSLIEIVGEPTVDRHRGYAIARTVE